MLLRLARFFSSMLSQFLKKLVALHLTTEEFQIDCGLYKTKFQVDASSGKMIDNGYFVNVYGEKIDYVPKHLELCSYITLDGIERAIRKELIINPNLLDF